MTTNSNRNDDVSREYSPATNLLWPPFHCLRDIEQTPTEGTDFDQRREVLTHWRTGIETLNMEPEASNDEGKAEKDEHFATCSKAVVGLHSNCSANSAEISIITKAAKYYCEEHPSVAEDFYQHSASDETGPSLAI